MTGEPACSRALPDQQHGVPALRPGTRARLADRGRSSRGPYRHLIGDRLAIAGSRWGVGGAEAILRLRVVIDNGDFETYGAFHMRREHYRVHQARYQDRYDLLA